MKPSILRKDNPSSFRPGKRHFCRQAWVFSAVFLLAALLVVAGCSRGSSSAGVSQPYEGTRLEGMAPDFRLLDQNSQPVALSKFRGKVVVLAFLDPRCTDVCPLTALSYRKASKALGVNAARVIFLAVNTNTNANSTGDVTEATENWGVDTLQNWHYLTGDRENLEPVWRAYNIEAEGPPKPGKAEELQHTPGVFIIDQQGRQRWYISVPLYDETGSGSALSDLLRKRVGSLLEEREQTPTSKAQPLNGETFASILDTLL